MRNGTFRFRKAGVAALSALTASVGLWGMAPAAHGAMATSAINKDPAAPLPAITPGATAQPAADWVVTLAPGVGNTTINNGQSIVIQVDDSNTTAVNCAAVGDWIGYTPDATITATDASATATGVTFSVDTTSSNPQCAGLSGGPIRDQLRLTAQGSGAVTDIVISGIEYDTGSAVAPGLLTITAPAGLNTASAAAPTINALSTPNAYVTVATVTTSPATLSTDATNQAINDITITETAPAALPDNDFVCVAITSPGTTWNETVDPTVDVTDGDAVVGSASFLTTTEIEFQVTTASTVASTITLSSLALDTTTPGPVTIFVGFAAASGDGCTGATADGTLSVSSVIASVGTANRISGVDRNGTARQVADHLGTCVDTGTPVAHTHNFAIVARNDDFADALAAGYLAGFHDFVGGGVDVRTPILLTSTGALPTDTVQSLHDRAIDQIIVVGGTAAVSQDVFGALSGLSVFTCSGTNLTAGVTGKAMAVSRIAGETRYDTARLIAQTVGQADTVAVPTVGTLGAGGVSGVTASRTAILASGVNFPDALTAAPMSILGDQAGTGNGAGFPLLLTATSDLPAETANALQALSIKQVIIVGGEAAVSASIATDLSGMGITATRLSGDDRTATAAAIAGFEEGAGSATVGGLGWVPVNPVVFLASGATFPDALSGGPLAALNQTPILLTAGADTLGDATAAFLGASGATAVTVLGGPAAITNTTLQDAVTALFAS